jgi:NADPH-dependent 2,4-dienoyl-CoA reductase/sulfur reductase-like enzyme
MHLVIVGGVAAGTKAAARARRVNPDLRITLFQDEPDLSYSGCGQPYHLGGAVPDREALIIRRAADFEREGIAVRVRHRVTELDTAGRTVQVHDLARDVAETLPYDRLILATGARPVIPPVPGIGLEGVVSLRSMAELDGFREALDGLRPRRAVIVGGGYIGLEVAEALRGLGLEVAIVEREAQLVPRLDPELSRRLAAALTAHGAELFPGEGLAGITGEGGRAQGVATESGRRLPADLVVLAIGVRPNVELAAAAGIALGSSGAIAVNARMETSAAGVYAAGDCAETLHRVSGRPVWGPLGDIANLQGRVAGENAAGGAAEFPGVLGTAIFKAFEQNVGLTGLTEAEASAAGFKPVATLIEARDKAGYFPGAKPLALKLVADARDGRLLGAQCVGPGAVDKMIDIAATALLGKLRCQDMEYADLAYAPPFSPVLSPIILAASQLSKVLP